VGVDMVINTIKEFFKKDPDFKIRGEISEDTSLIELGVLDSFSMVKLVAYLESAFNIKIEISDLTEENMESLKTIEALVIKKMRKWSPTS
jgi:acyl carrier protein